MYTFRGDGGSNNVNLVWTLERTHLIKNKKCTVLVYCKEIINKIRNRNNRNSNSCLNSTPSQHVTTPKTKRNEFIISTFSLYFIISTSTSSPSPELSLSKTPITSVISVHLYSILFQRWRRRYARAREKR